MRSWFTRLCACRDAWLLPNDAAEISQVGKSSTDQPVKYEVDCDMKIFPCEQDEGETVIAMCECFSP